MKIRLILFIILLPFGLAAQKIPPLTLEDAKGIIQKYIEKEFYVFNAANAGESFESNGYAYDYLPAEIDNREKLTNYLSDVFSPEASQSFIQELGLIEKNGKLAKIAMGGGSIEEWENCIIVPLNTQTDKLKKEFSCEVPYFDEDKQKNISRYSFTFQYIKKKGWKIYKKTTVRG